MKAEKQTLNLKIEVSIIACPKCSSTFIVHYALSGELISQVPDSGSPFFCPYCGVDVNKSEEVKP